MLQFFTSSLVIQVPAWHTQKCSQIMQPDALLLAYGELRGSPSSTLFDSSHLVYNHDYIPPGSASSLLPIQRRANIVKHCATFDTTLFI